jgi:chemotaxis protein histidine kinase CheA
MLEDLREHLIEGKPVEALAVLHTLKGIAYTVGVRPVADFVEHEEEELKRSRDTRAAILRLGGLISLLRAQGAALSQFASALQSEDQHQSVLTYTNDIVPVAAKTLLDDLAALLEERNMRATTVFGMLKAQHRSSFGRTFEDLEAAVEGLDFRRARELIQILRKTS